MFIFILRVQCTNNKQIEHLVAGYCTVTFLIDESGHVTEFKVGIDVCYCVMEIMIVAFIG